MDRLTAIRVFVQVADKGSLTAAATNLDMSRAMVSRYLQVAESWLNARLLHRSTRKVTLTAAGSSALAHCRQIIELAEETRLTLRSEDDLPHGLIRISSSVSFAQARLSAAVTEYVSRYPMTAVDILANDRTVNLVEDRIDLAIRITNTLDPSLIARKLGSCHSVVCASPAYLEQRGSPLIPEDLADHNCLTYSYFGKSLWSFTRNGMPFPVQVCGNISANEVSILTQAVLAGAGIALQPRYAVDQLIKEGKLVELLPDFAPDEMGIYGVYTSRKQMPATLRAMLDFLVEQFEQNPL